MTEARRLGVLGTFVWDTIWTLADQEAGRPFETWGGVTYSLSAAAAACPAGWEVVPVAKVGADLFPAVREYVAALPNTVVSPALVAVPEANNRVELRYTSDARRGERMTGGVPGWTWEELAPHVAGLDALYVNFLSGFEMELETAEALRAGFGGPLYTDLHSLFLGCPSAGARAPRPLPEWERWAACWDAVQLNEEELEMLSGTAGSWREGAVPVLRQGPGLVAETQGAEGAGVALREDFPEDPARWPTWRAGRGGLASVAAGFHPTGGCVVGDPTGCGDVWGSTFFASLLGGHAVAGSVRRAHDAAARKVSHRGATGLYEHLVRADS